MRFATKLSLSAATAFTVLATAATSLGGFAGSTANAAPLTLTPDIPPGAARPAAVALRDEADIDRSGERDALLADPAALAARVAQLTTQARQIKSHSKSILTKIAKAKAAYEARVKEMGYDPKTTDPREIARQMMQNKYGWGDNQFACYDKIIMRESRWIWNADNPTSSAYGIPQALPGSKMASAGADWRTNPATQIKWGLGYVAERYGTPCSAWGFKASHGWY